MLVAGKDIHFCAVCWWSSVPSLQRSTSGADKKLRHRPFGAGHCDHAALDQSAKKFRTELANSSRFQRYFCTTGGDQIATGSLQQRQLPLLETRNSRIDYAICFCATRVECLARPATRALRSVFREPMEQHVVWPHRCASSNHQSDQWIYSCFSHTAGSTAKQIDPCRLMCRPRHLAPVADVRIDRTNQLVLPDG